MKNKGYSKIAVILALLLITATSLWFVLPLVICYAQGYGGAVGGGGGAALPPSYTFLRDKTDQYGVLLEDTTAQTYDGCCELTLGSGTEVRTRYGDPLHSILMVEAKVTPDPPPDGDICGKVYDCRPDGAVFNPAGIITLEYPPSQIREGVSVKNLVIAYRASPWTNLEGPFTIDEEKNTISAPVSHFTEFAVIAYTNPADYTISGLNISPTEISTGQDITVDVNVTNSGDLEGSHEVILKIDNQVIATSNVTLVGHTSQKVTFNTTVDYGAGDYEIDVNGLSGTLIVKEPVTPAPAPAPVPAPAPAPVPPPVPVPAPVPAPAPAPVPPPVPVPIPAPETPVTPVTPAMPINWWLIGGSIAAIIIITILIWLVVTRRKV